MFGGVIASHDNILRIGDNDSRIQRFQHRCDMGAHRLRLAEMLAKAGIGLGQLKIHLLEPGRQGIIRLLEDGRRLIEVLKGARQQIVLGLLRLGNGMVTDLPGVGDRLRLDTCMTAAMRRTRPSLFH